MRPTHHPALGDLAAPLGSESLTAALRTPRPIRPARSVGARRAAPGWASASATVFLPRIAAFACPFTSASAAAHSCTGAHSQRPLSSFHRGARGSQCWLRVPLVLALPPPRADPLAACRAAPFAPPPQLLLVCACSPRGLGLSPAGRDVSHSAWREHASERGEKQPPRTPGQSSDVRVRREAKAGPGSTLRSCDERADGKARGTEAP